MNRMIQKRHSRRSPANRLMLLALGVGAAYLLNKLAKKSNDYSFAGRTVLITGGSRGLGLVMARQLTMDGARVALVARDPLELDRVRQQLQDIGGVVYTFACDVTKPDEVSEMIRTIRSDFGEIDVLINNAGVIEVGPAESMTRADYEEAMNIHFWGAYNVIEALIPEMRLRGEGRIVNISSIGGKISLPHMLPYCASKHALNGFSKGLRAELAKDGIVVTTVSPGLMRTGSHVNATFKSYNEKEYALFSIGNALPFLSMDAAKASRAILDACRRGVAETMLSPQSMILDKSAALFPGPFYDLMGLANKLMPGFGGIGSQKRTGEESRSDISSTLITHNIDRAAVVNMELRNNPTEPT